VFTKELGMWDGDPVSLHPHTPVDSAQRLVAMVGRDAILAEGRRAIEEADYRWAAQILHHLVFADPDDTEAQNLQADAYEQLGYQAEGPQWRGIYLTAAKELRDGILPAQFASASPDTILAMPIAILFDFVAIHLDGPAAADADVRLDFTFAGTGETWSVRVRNGVLNARPGASPDAQATLSGPKAALVGLLLQPGAATALLEKGAVTVTGDGSRIDAFIGLLVRFDADFAIVTP
jgi:alkyl sulfatase BDS1-like metallo-beta-lactamase superfamily hydrolase